MKHRYTPEELIALRRAFDAQLLTAAALIFSTEEEIDTDSERVDVMEKIVVDVMDLRDAILIEIQRRDD